LRGGLYTPGMPQQANDFQETHLRAILGFIGIEDIDIVRPEGLAYGARTARGGDAGRTGIGDYGCGGDFPRKGRLKNGLRSCGRRSVVGSPSAWPSGPNALGPHPRR
jgi:hypothetical protein